MSPQANAFLQRTLPIFSALGDETRLYVVAQLSAHGPRSITRLAEGTTVSRQAVTKHLNVLEEAGLVRGFRAGRERLYELHPERLDDARRTLDLIATRWDEALARLQKLVEE